jgi:hypothetical protein
LASSISENGSYAECRLATDLVPARRKYREVEFMFKTATAICAIGFFAAAGSFVWAAVPVTTIQSWRDAATDVVSITVLSVDQKTSTIGTVDRSATTYDISLTARVDVVDRSSNDLTPQTKIIVHYGAQYYEGSNPPPPGGNYGTILKIGQKAKAYLKKNGNEYRLAGDIGCLEKL